jgi:hypothetical protein
MLNDAKQDYIFSTYRTKKSDGPLGQGNIVDLGLGYVLTKLAITRIITV